MEGYYDKMMPRQPFILFATKHYEKVEMMQYGISHFYTFHADGEFFDLAEVLPDGCVDIMFIRHKNRSSAIYIGTPLHADALAHCHFFAKDDLIFGVRFLQGNMTWMRHCCAKELLNASFDFAAISGETELIESICDCMDFQKQIQIFMQRYLPEYQKVHMKLLNRKNPAFYMMQQMLGSNGNVRIQKLSEEMAFSVRHLNEMFRTAYGVSPKEFEKLVRFQNSLTQLEQNNRISDAAMAAGYYDQSHLLKEFRSLVGISPKMYLQKRKLLMQENPLFLQQMSIFSQAMAAPIVSES